jgi:DNA-binding NtrC family response regulator
MAEASAVRGFRVRAVSGPDAGAEAAPVDGRLTVGTAENATLRLTDRTVSRYHLDLEGGAEGVCVRDLGSKNGTLLGSTLVREIVVSESTELTIGDSRVRIAVGAEKATVPLSARTSFGGLLGASPAMRAVYAALEHAAPTQVSVLLLGESGTGKELAARALHAASSRASGAFEVVDCGGLSPTLVESELFGHVRGAFTGADRDRTGALERADGGTLFLDELGELPLEVQPKLLRALGEREIRPVGGVRARRVDVRIVAATNRDLRRAVNEGSFREDLYYRFAVICIRMPPLRERLEDLPLLLSALLLAMESELGLASSSRSELSPFGLERADRSNIDPPEREPSHDSPERLVQVLRMLREHDVDLDALHRHHWPGNVRELRNWLQHLIVLRTPPRMDDPCDAAIERLPLHKALERFERAYVKRCLDEARGNVATGAALAGVNRATMYRLIQRFGLRPIES